MSRQTRKASSSRESQSSCQLIAIHPVRGWRTVSLRVGAGLDDMETGDAAAGSMERLVVEESAGSVARRPVSGRLIGDCGLSPKPGGCRLEPAPAQRGVLPEARSFLTRDVGAVHDELSLATIVEVEL